MDAAGENGTKNRSRVIRYGIGCAYIVLCCVSLALWWVHRNNLYWKRPLETLVRTNTCLLPLQLFLMGTLRKNKPSKKEQLFWAVLFVFNVVTLLVIPAVR